MKKIDTTHAIFLIFCIITIIIFIIFLFCTNKSKDSMKCSYIGMVKDIKCASLKNECIIKLKNGKTVKTNYLFFTNEKDIKCK